MIQEEVYAAADTGLYDSAGEFMADAIRTLLAARPDVRVAMSCALYERGALSLGRAVELSGLDIERLKEALSLRGISREAPEGPTETAMMARSALTAGKG